MNTKFTPTVRRISPGLLLIMFLVPQFARAQCGSPLTSTTPHQIVVCPLGDIPFTVIIRDAMGNPCVGTLVTMSISNLCPCGGPMTVSAVTDNFGSVTFSPAAGGCCSATGLVTLVDAAGVVLGSIPFINSPDINGDCRVNLTDISLFAGLYFAGTGQCGDLSNDNVINLTDVSILSHHIGH